MIIAEIEKNSKEKIIISIQEYKGHKFIDSRVYLEDNMGTWRPTRKGITLNKETVKVVIEALQKAIPEIHGQSGVSTMTAQKILEVAL